MSSTYRLKHEHSPFVDSHDSECKCTYGKQKKKTEVNNLLHTYTYRSLSYFTGTIHLLSRIWYFGSLYQQIRCGDFTLFGNDRDATTRRIIIYFLKQRRKRENKRYNNKASSYVCIVHCTSYKFQENIKIYLHPTTFLYYKIVLCKSYFDDHIYSACRFYCVINLNFIFILRHFFLFSAV